MPENNGSPNKQQKKADAQRELTPWLKKRFDERARPLAAGWMLKNRPALISSGHQHRSRLSEASSHLMRWVAKRTGPHSVISGASRLPFLSEAFLNILNRTATETSPDKYRMLDLPWFRSGTRSGIRPGDNTGALHRQKITLDLSVGSDDTIVRSLYDKQTTQVTKSEKSPESPVHRFPRPTGEQRPGQDIPEKTDGTIYQSLSEPAEHKQSERKEKTPESYIDRLISPTITRKITPGIGQHAPGILPGKEQIPVIYRTAESIQPDDGNKATERKPPVASAIRPGSSVPSRQISEAGRPDISRIEQGKYGSNTDGRNVKISRELMDRQLPTSPQPRSISRFQAEYVAGISDMSTPVNTDHQKTISGKSVTDSSYRQQDTPLKISGTPPVNRSHTRETPPLSHGDSVTVSGITVKIDREQNTGYRSPVKNLFYNRPLRVARKIAQSLPLLKNVSRKNTLPPEPVISPIDEKKGNLNSAYEPLKDLEVVPVNKEIAVIAPENIAVPGSSARTNATMTDSFISRDYVETGYGDRTAEQSEKKISVGTGKDNIVKGAKPAYPAKNLFYKEFLPFTLKVIPSFPLVGNISRKVIPSPDPVERPIGSKQVYPFTSIQTLKYNESVQEYGDRDKVGESAGNLPLALPAVTGRRIQPVGEDMLLRYFSETVPGSLVPVNPKLDLSLAPVSRMSSPERQDESLQLGQSIGKPPLNTAILQRQTSQATSQSAASQTSATETQEERANQNVNTQDIRALAREIYPFIRRMIMVERERRPY